MGRGKSEKCPHTGISISTLMKAPDCFRDENEHFRISMFPKCNQFDVRSIAAAAGFRDHAYYCDVVLVNPSSPFHMHKAIIIDEVTRRRLATVYATHQNSAEAGGRRWHDRQRELARQRAQQANINLGGSTPVPQVVSGRAHDSDKEENEPLVHIDCSSGGPAMAY